MIKGWGVTIALRRINDLYVTGFWKITHMGTNDTVNI